jgi:hypothetical protein
MKLAVEHQYTRDAKVPLVAGDEEFAYGWRCIPIPPSVDEGWDVF